MKRETDWASVASVGLVAALCAVGAWQLFVPAPAQGKGKKDEPAKQEEKTPEAKPTSEDEKAAPKKEEAAGHGTSSLRYRVNEPDKTFVLDDTLDEISDLALDPDGKSLWAVHDEKGILYRLSTTDGSVLQTLEFHKKGDFEGVAYVDGKVVAGKSNGELFFVDPKSAEETHYDTGVGPGCNLEGLAYEPEKKRMLLACKSPRGESQARYWAVFGLNLETKKLEKDPVFRVTQQAIDTYLRDHRDQTDLAEWMAKDFDPSGIAIHPTTKQIYMTSTRGHLIMLLDESGTTVLSIERLRRDVHPQPEGIAFLADGTMFLSSEARGKHPLMSKFTEQPAAQAQAH